MNTQETKSWHALTEAQALEFLHVNELHGLSSTKVNERQTQFGANRLTPKKGKSPFLLFLSQFHDPLIYILLASSVITAALKGWVDASVIFGVVFLNAIIGFIQEKMHCVRLMPCRAR